MPIWLVGMDNKDDDDDDNDDDDAVSDDEPFRRIEHTYI